MDACSSSSAFSTAPALDAGFVPQPFGIDLLNGNFPRVKQSQLAGCSPNADITLHARTGNVIYSSSSSAFCPSSSSHPLHLQPQLSTCTSHRTKATNLCSSFTSSCPSFSVASLPLLPLRLCTAQDQATSSEFTDISASGCKAPYYNNHD